MRLFPCSVLNITYTYTYEPIPLAKTKYWRNVFSQRQMHRFANWQKQRAATLGDRKSIVLINEQGLFLLFKWRTFSFRKYKFHALISKFKIKWFQIKFKILNWICICLGVVVLQQFQAWGVLNLNKKIFALHIKESTKMSGFFIKWLVIDWSKNILFSRRNLNARELQFWINLIDRVTQHDFVDTNFGQSCSKIEIWFMLITKLIPHSYRS